MKRMLALLFCCLLMTSLCACVNEQPQVELQIPMEEITYISNENSLPENMIDNDEISQKVMDMIDECPVFLSKVQLEGEEKCKEHMLLMWQQLYAEASFVRRWRPDSIIHYTNENKIVFCYYVKQFQTEKPMFYEDWWYIVVVDDRSGSLLFADQIFTDIHNALLDESKTEDG